MIVGDDGKRLIAFGKFAGRAGMIDFLSALGQRMLFSDLCHSYITDIFMSFCFIA